ncbi:MAG: peptidase MA family metallohydrolase [Bacillota bacterium]
MAKRARIFVSLLVSLLILAGAAMRADLYIKSLAREANRRYVTWQSRDMYAVRGDHFVVFSKPAQKDSAPLVLAVAEKFYPAIARDFGLHNLGPSPVILYGDMADLNSRFGWHSSYSTMGVYWAGTIHVLAPHEWAGEGEVEEQFASNGPMAHEITHLAVDVLTRGSCPRWFNEGIAQYEEYRLTGFSFADPLAFDFSTAYSLAELTDFDALADQTKAYNQVFSMVYFAAEEFGWPALRNVLADLGRGRGLDRALAANLGADLSEFIGLWSDWLVQGQESFSGLPNMELM